ncbi:MAG: membrane protein insertase YidC [Geobacteraceae bacterium]|nr:membrane protein insertase YidC [Geobacteraceae bacterium]
MEKRALLAVVLSLGFFYLYTMLFPAPETKKPVAAVQSVATSAKAPQASSAAATLPRVKADEKVSPPRDVQVETDLFSMVFSTQGAGIKSLILKKYHETADRGSKPVSLISSVNPEKFALRISAPGLSLDQSAIYETGAQSLKLSGDEKKRLDFVWKSPQGIIVTKTFVFTGNKYEVAMENKIVNQGTEKRTSSMNCLLPHQADVTAKQGRFEVNAAVTLADGSFASKPAKDLVEKPARYTQNVAWTGYADKYFLSAVLAESGSIGSAAIQKNPSGILETVIASKDFELPPGQSQMVDFRLFFGPKDLDILKAENAGLEKALDLGWFSAIANPLLYVLKYFYKYTHNYGIAIIIITVIIKLLFFPLTHKSYKSMKDMQKLQPKMAELKEKFKDDRDGMNKGMMELYKTHKVNPLGGCLPMVIQIPVFFALYKALMYSIELRHAPFMFWITDLSAKDPYYVTPIIMGVTMFIQQKMTPSTMDPMQAKMMMALPIVFTFMFLNFPSGLVIYWLVNNILTIAQQMYINRITT